MINRAEKSYEIISLFGSSKFSVDKDREHEIIDYFLKNQIALTFIRGLISIVERVYEGKAELIIDLFEDFDQPVSHQLRALATIYSGLPIDYTRDDDEFSVKNDLVFNEIEKTGLIGGFKYVILTQG